MGNLQEIKEKAAYCLNCPTKPCTKGCPLGNNIPDFIKCIKEEKYEEAYNILAKTTVLQPICGRICPHEKQCQGNCVRRIKGEPVSIGELETFIGDRAISEGYDIEYDEEGDSFMGSWEYKNEDTGERIYFQFGGKTREEVAIDCLDWYRPTGDD